jgi:hypothetical protein
MSTDPRVAAELARLAGATDRRLREHDRASAGRRRQWYRERFADRPVPGQGPLEQAYRLLLARLGIGEEDAPIVERGPDRLVFHSRNFCPTLEACRILDLDTRRVCRQEAPALHRVLRGDHRAAAYRYSLCRRCRMDRYSSPPTSPSGRKLTPSGRSMISRSTTPSTASNQGSSTATSGTGLKE